MSTKLVIHGTTYEYPDAGETPDWGNDAAEWAAAVTEALNLLVSSSDILQTSFVIANNQTAPELVRGLYFNPSQVRAANISYSIYRTTDSSSLIESGDVLITYDPKLSTGQRWVCAFRTNGSADVILTIDDSGQFSYTSSNLSGTNYAGVMKFTARSLSV